MKLYETLFEARSIARKIDTIIVHCAATSANSPVTTEDIARWHIRDRHFRDIGYHFIVDQKGVIHVGRPLEEMGAHCRGYNATSIGICYIGGLDAQGNPADTRTPLQQLAIKHLIGLLVNEFKIYDVLGHRDLSPDINGDGVITSVDWVKMCPCYDAHAEWLQYLKEMAIVARNYGQAQSDGGVSITPELQNLCSAAEEYLQMEWGEGNPQDGTGAPVDTGYPPEREPDMSFSLMHNPNDTNPVPPLPDALFDDKVIPLTQAHKLSFGGWRDQGTMRN